MLPASSLSRAAHGLRDLLMSNIDDIDAVDQIKIGHPADTLKDLENSNANCLNLFFYDVNYDGYPADGTSANPFYVRLHCLITAIGNKSKEPEAPGSNTKRDVSKGENELRLIGEVMRVLHEQPVISVSDENENEIAELQVVPHTMNLDNLNHIWSTQNETSYRLSVAYEMALAPIPNVAPADTSPLVGDSGMLSWGAMRRPPEEVRTGIISLKPTVEYLEVDTNVEDWAPHICFVEEVSASEKNLHYVFNVEAGDVGSPLKVLVAAKEDSTVKLVWDVWRRKTDRSIVAWKEDIPDSVSDEVVIVNPPTSTELFFANRIDPENIDDRRVFEVRLPADVAEADTQTWQAMLHAVREWDHEEPAGSGELVTTLLKSNSVLFYGAGP